MTGFEIYANANAMMYIDTGKSISDEKFNVRFINTLLQETLQLENNLREADGMPTLTQAPLIGSLDIDIEYHDAITRGCLPYALMAIYQQEELDYYQSSLYRGLYQQACADIKKGVWVEV